MDTTRAWRPIAAVWGVVVEVQLADPPRHVVEEAGVEAVATAADAVAGGSVFSAVTSEGLTAVGSTFLRAEPDAEVWVDALMDRGRRFLPALAGASPLGARACARPQSADGRPLLGEIGGIDGLWVAAGHGPWGISTGPASARLVVDALLGRGEISGPLAAQRFD